MVDAISAVKATSASSESIPVDAEKSMSIDSEPDNRYVAWRQSQINAALYAMRLAGDREATGDASLRKAEEEVDSQGGHSELRGNDHLPPRPHGADDEPNSRTLSGESDHIGTVEYDDGTPFGRRTSFI